MIFMHFVINNLLLIITLIISQGCELIDYIRFRYFNIEIILYYHRYQKYRYNYFRCNQQNDHTK